MIAAAKKKKVHFTDMLVLWNWIMFINPQYVYIFIQM